MIIHNYFSLSKWKIYRKIIHKLNLTNVKIILDLEDSVQDVNSKSRTKELKRRAREGLKNIVENPDFQKNKDNHFVRINAFDSPYFKEDIATIYPLVNQGLIQPKIIVAKTESIDQLEFIANLFKGHQGLELVPMLESKQSFDNREKILKSMAEYIVRKNISFVYWGYFDYALDSNLFPFYAIDDQEFWKTIESFDALLRHYQLNLVSPAFCYFDQATLLKIKSTLFKYFSSTLCIASLGIEQTKVFLDQDCSATPYLLQTYSYSIQEKEILAKEIIKEFELFRREYSDRSFAMANHCRFISPHEYLAAKKYLEMS